MTEIIHVDALEPIPTKELADWEHGDLGREVNRLRVQLRAARKLREAARAYVADLLHSDLLGANRTVILTEEIYLLEDALSELDALG